MNKWVWVALLLVSVNVFSFPKASNVFPLNAVDNIYIGYWNLLSISYPSQNLLTKRYPGDKVRFLVGGAGVLDMIDFTPYYLTEVVRFIDAKTGTKYNIFTWAPDTSPKVDFPGADYSSSKTISMAALWMVSYDEFSNVITCEIVGFEELNRTKTLAVCQFLLVKGP